MALFEFELARVEDIVPWESGLSWFALTDGRFWMPVGDQVQFEYTNEIMAHWGNNEHSADYQVAAYARDILGSFAAAMAPLPDRIERMAADWNRLRDMEKSAQDLAHSGEEQDLAYRALRWLGERSPWTSYVAANPHFHFVRVDDAVQIHWDNRDQIEDGLSVWSAQVGVHTMKAESFEGECRDFAQRLLSEMADRIRAVERGKDKAQIDLDVKSLWNQHQEWETEFASYFSDYTPDIEWQDTEQALEVIAGRKGLPF